METAKIFGLYSNGELNENSTCKDYLQVQTEGNLVADHFGEVTEMAPIGSGAWRGFRSYKLSCYAYPNLQSAI